MKTSSKGGSGAPKQLPPADTYLSRNIGIVDIGTQDVPYAGTIKKIKQVIFFFELLGIRHVFDEAKGLQPFTISTKLTNSLNEKANMRKFLQSWSGKSIEDLPLDMEGNLDIMNVFKGKACMINVIHAKDKKNPLKSYANINSISPPMTQLGTPPPAENALILFDFEDPSTHKNFDTLYPWLQELIGKSAEYAKLFGGQSQAPVNEFGNEDYSTKTDAPF